jgi:transposase
MTIIGVDPHPGSHTAVALNEQGKRLGTLTFQNSEGGLSQFQAWLSGYEIERCAIEGANNPFARSLSQLVLKAGHQLVDVSPSLTSQYRSKRGYKKSDEVDAENVAKVVLANPEIARFASQAKIEELKTLTRTRETLVEHVKAQRLSLTTLSVELARQALEQVIAVMQEQIKQLEKAMHTLVKDLMPELLEVKGVGVILAATLLAEVGDVRRFRSQHSFAMFAGCAPVERSSGGCQRQQLNIGGNRRLNRTFHMLAIIRLRLDDDTKDYLTKKKAEGKTRRAALRCLKTHLARSIFRFMLSTMQQHPERWLTA